MLLQLKIQLKNISKPPIWRRVLVPDNFSFDRLHDVIQASFGWQNSHLYHFSPQGYGSYPTITIPSPEYDDEITDSRKTKLKKIFTRVGQTFTYLYDFGDDWEHKITLEQVINHQSLAAELMAGKGACPPEDCGGPGGYKILLEIMNDPMHEAYESTREWLMLEDGEKWDPNLFDLDEAKNDVAFFNKHSIKKF